MVAIKLDIPKALKVTLAGTGGFTLVEVVVALSLLSLATGMIGAGLFQVHSMQKFWRDGAVATSELRRAGSGIAGDALKAQNVLTSPPPSELVLPCNPGSPSSTVTLIRSDSDGTNVITHVVTYAVVGDELTRTYDGATMIVARDIVSDSVGFSLCNNVLTFDLTVNADGDNTESISLKTHIRKLD